MSVLDIRKYPDPVLREEASPVESVDPEVVKLMDDMLETMYADHGVGLAAPQVGVSLRVIVMDAAQGFEPGDPDKPPVIQLANPEIVSAEGTIEFEEGCLSLPDFRATIKRSEHIKVKALDREGRQVMVDAGGLLAIVLQHEIDHLDGKLILDRASTLKREFYKKRVKKALSKAG